MNAKNIIQKLTLGAFSLSAISAAAITGFGPSSSADALQEQGTGQLVLPAANTYHRAATGTTGTFRLTFQGQTTAPSQDDMSLSLNYEKYKSSTGFGKDGTKGGNVEFEWKVEEGESFAKR